MDAVCEYNLHTAIQWNGDEFTVSLIQLKKALFLNINSNQTDSLYSAYRNFPSTFIVPKIYKFPANLVFVKQKKKNSQSFRFKRKERK